MAEQVNNAPAVSGTIADQLTVTVKGNDGASVKITKKILMDTICKGMKISDGDMVQFLTLCQVNQLNPFTREAYLVKYGDQPSQMITSKEAFFKRADNCPGYEGIESGVIGMDGEGNCKDFEGAFLPPKWSVVGAWAKVYRTGRRPSTQRVAYSEYNKNQSTWKQMPLTMIRKVAEVQALREAFPNNLSGMYIPDESRIVDTQYTEISSEQHNVNDQEKTKVVVSMPSEGKKGAPQPFEGEGGTTTHNGNNNATEGANGGSAPTDEPGF